jgi:glutaredoxin
MTRARSSVRRKLDPQATARNPAECATTGARPTPRVDPEKLTARVLWLTEVTRELHVRQLNLEALISHAPDLRRVLMARTGRRTVPQIYIDDYHVGGYEELVELDHAGRLAPMLAGAVR